MYPYATGQQGFSSPYFALGHGGHSQVVHAEGRHQGMVPGPGAGPWVSGGADLAGSAGHLHIAPLHPMCAPALLPPLYTPFLGHPAAARGVHGVSNTPTMPAPSFTAPAPYPPCAPPLEHAVWPPPSAAKQVMPPPSSSRGRDKAPPHVAAAAAPAASMHVNSLANSNTSKARLIIKPPPPQQQQQQQHNPPTGMPNSASSEGTQAGASTTHSSQPASGEDTSKPGAPREPIAPSSGTQVHSPPAALSTGLSSSSSVSACLQHAHRPLLTTTIPEFTPRSTAHAQPGKPPSSLVAAPEFRPRAAQQPSRYELSGGAAAATPFGSTQASLKAAAPEFWPAALHCSPITEEQGAAAGWGGEQEWEWEGFDEGEEVEEAGYGGFEGEEAEEVGYGGYEGEEVEEAGYGGYEGEEVEEAGYGGYEGEEVEEAGYGGYEGGGAEEVGKGYEGWGADWWPKEGGYKMGPEVEEGYGYYFEEDYEVEGVGWEESMGVAQGYEGQEEEQEWEGQEEESAQEWVDDYRQQTEGGAWGGDDGGGGWGEEEDDEGYAGLDQAFDEGFCDPATAADYWQAEGFATWGQQQEVSPADAAAAEAAQAALALAQAWNRAAPLRAQMGHGAGLRPDARPFSALSGHGAVSHAQPNGVACPTNPSPGALASYPAFAQQQLPLTKQSSARLIKDPASAPKSGPREIRPPPPPSCAGPSSSSSGEQSGGGTSSSRSGGAGGSGGGGGGGGAVGSGSVGVVARGVGPTPFPVHARIGVLPSFLTPREREVYARLISTHMGHEGHPKPILPRGVSEQMLDRALGTGLLLVPKEKGLAMSDRDSLHGTYRCGATRAQVLR